MAPCLGHRRPFSLIDVGSVSTASVWREEFRAESEKVERDKFPRTGNKNEDVPTC